MSHRTALLQRGCVQRLFVWIILTFFCVHGARAAHAHGVTASNAHVQCSGDVLYVDFTFDASDVATHFPLATPADAPASAEILQHFAEWIAAHWQLATAPDARLPLHCAASLHNDAMPGAAQISVECASALDAPPDAFVITLDAEWFARFGVQHQHWLSMTHHARTESFVLSANAPTQRISLISPAREQTWRAWLRLGLAHIVSGHDHIAFLLALLVAGGSLWRLLGIATAFTVAHSITLILAVLRVVHVPAPLVEILIALTIVFVAVDNIFGRRAHRVSITLLFGLIHGLGFANALSELPIDASTLGVGLLAFNLGIELGQLAILLAFYAVLRVVAYYGSARIFCGVISSLVAACGLGWMIERIFGWSFMPV